MLQGEGNDNVVLGAGDGKLNRDSGRDYLIGGKGADFLTGGVGPDTFIYDSAVESGIMLSDRDRIIDFVSGTDKIDLHSIDAIPGGADDPFNLQGIAAAFTRVGDLRLVQSGLTTMLVNLGADPGSEMSILLRNVVAATDFIL